MITFIPSLGEIYPIGGPTGNESPRRCCPEAALLCHRPPPLDLDVDVVPVALCQFQPPVAARPASTTIASSFDGEDSGGCDGGRMMKVPAVVMEVVGLGN